MKYEILGAKDDLGNDVKDKWEIINMATGNKCTNKFYNTYEEAYPDLSWLYVAEYLPLPKTSTPEETRLALLKHIVDAFNDLTSGELIDVLFGNRGVFSIHGRGDGAFKISESTCIEGHTENMPCQHYDGTCKCQHYKR